MPSYQFRIYRAGSVETTDDLNFKDDAAALSDAQLALGDAIRDLALNPKSTPEQPGGTMQRIEVFNQQGDLIGEVPPR